MDPPDAPETSASASPSSEPQSTPVSENGNKTVSFLRFLISNAAAGSVIGKGGSTISEFQAKSGARIQLSRNHEYFPGTTDRVIVLSGTTDEIMSSFKLILTKIYSETEELKPKANQVKLVVPHIVCGAIIGKGGTTIRNFIKDSNAIIKLSSPQESIPGIRDRVVTVTGNLTQQLHAVDLITKKISEDANYVQYASAPIYTGRNWWALQHQYLPFAPMPAATAFSYGTIPYSYPMKGVMAPYIPMHGMPVPVQVPIVAATSPSSYSMMVVPDESIGAIVGRGGKTISDIQQMSGVHIKISDQGDFLPGTTDRKVTIIGSPESIYTAQQIIMQKITQSSSGI